MPERRTEMTNQPPITPPAPGQQPPGGENQPAENAPLDYSAWLDEQAEPVKNMLIEKQKRVSADLAAERDTRHKLEKQVRDLAARSEKDGETQKQLNQLADQMAIADRRADFYEQAHSAGVTNLKLALIVAEQEDLFDKRGGVNFEVMKKSYPELFGAGRTVPPGNAGAGTNRQPSAPSMNDFIRAAAGRK